MPNEPVMNAFIVGLALLLISLGVWYVTAEHYEDLMRQQAKEYQQLVERNQLLEAEWRAVDKELSRLTHSFETYADVLEGDTPELEVML